MIMREYAWAANAAKLQRAFAGGGSEEDIKERYIQIGGLVIDEPTPESVAEEPVINESINDPEPISEPTPESVKAKKTKSGK